MRHFRHEAAYHEPSSLCFCASNSASVSTRRSCRSASFDSRSNGSSSVAGGLAVADFCGFNACTRRRDSCSASSRLDGAIDDNLAVIGRVIEHADDPQGPIFEPRRGLGVERRPVVGLYPHRHLPQTRAQFLAAHRAVVDPRRTGGGGQSDAGGEHRSQRRPAMPTQLPLERRMITEHRALRFEPGFEPGQANARRLFSPAPSFMP